MSHAEDAEIRRQFALITASEGVKDIDQIIDAALNVMTGPLAQAKSKNQLPAVRVASLVKFLKMTISVMRDQETDKELYDLAIVIAARSIDRLCQANLAQQ